MAEELKPMNDRNRETPAEPSSVVPSVGLPPEEQLMTTRELMDFLNVSRTKAWELVTKQGLPAFKIGGDYRYRRAEVIAWLEKYRVKPGEKEG